MNFLARVVCFFVGHYPQTGYPEGYQPPYCDTCGMEDPPTSTFEKMPRYGEKIHKVFSKFYWFVARRIYAK